MFARKSSSSSTSISSERKKEIRLTAKFYLENKTEIGEFRGDLMGYRHWHCLRSLTKYHVVLLSKVTVRN